MPPPPGIGTLGRAIGSQLYQPTIRPAPAPKPANSSRPPEADFDRSIDYYADYSGCGHWRMIWPGHMLNAHQKAVIGKTCQNPTSDTLMSGKHTSTRVTCGPILIPRV